MTDSTRNSKVGLIIGLLVVGGLFLWLFLTLNRLFENAQAVYLYNPHAETMVVKINKNDYAVNPKELLKIEISPGEYSIRSNVRGSAIVDTTVKLFKNKMEKGGVLNVSGEPFYKWSEMYGSEPILDIYSLADSSDVGSPIDQRVRQGLSVVQIDSTFIVGKIETYPARRIFLPKDWDYDLITPLPDEIQSSEHQDLLLGKYASKLFDEDGLLEYWEENYAP